MSDRRFMFIRSRNFYIARRGNGPVARYVFRSLTWLENEEQFGVSLNLGYGETCQAEFEFICQP